MTNIVGDLAVAGAKALPNWPRTFSKAIYDALSMAKNVGQKVKTTGLQVRDDGIITTAINTSSRALSSRVADAALRFATDVFAAAGDTAIVDLILEVIGHSLEALTQSLSAAALIVRGIFTNDTNETTLGFILDHLSDLFQFILDMIQPENVIPRFATAGGTIEKDGGEFPGRDNPYNELDLRRDANRHAVVYQVQRVLLTLAAILKQGREGVPSNGLEGLEMNITLRSDFKDGAPPPPTHVSKLEGSSTYYPNEKWLFINGIANELVWFRLSCDKIRDTFKREVKGIYNRSDGILWDLIECAGERSAAETNANIERTRSSKAAQAILEQELRDALWPADGSVPDKVVMIAHSQGCMILRLALQTLVQEISKDSNRTREMRERLRVFTFGNPSIDWRVVVDGTEDSLSNYAMITEHFAHQTDFVAVLGVVGHRDDRDSGYDKDSVFYTKKGKGHLFGAHYPLGADAYENGMEAKLFEAVNGNEIA
ncbi:hypothetical protein MYCTH_2128368 [Thermothelomyces thermophilus ATCC 42464]|uniref:DUF676 domain-containing protein n=1 Tax=Thermothelomyces thermophilus (strain ATCC 42464 / BCRC 31852 / DSM 1799) TaxID=573729 RepID=G2QG02_THET4|nr:uncharacterized protein MYCTH_2128368 [Thermothelomyces thermophilus ATCC 42464]AEO59315.1 hypothetical protein MYCTH_2128368 [Thermothelomyces thermophilus ATCC 42464]